MDIGCTPFLFTNLCILVSIYVSWSAFSWSWRWLEGILLWLEYIWLWLEDRLEDIPFSSLSSSLYSVKSQRVAPILGDMADFFAYRVIMHETASLLLKTDYGWSLTTINPLVRSVVKYFMALRATSSLFTIVLIHNNFNRATTNRAEIFSFIIMTMS